MNTEISETANVTGRWTELVVLYLFHIQLNCVCSGVAGQWGPGVWTPLSWPVGSMRNVKIRWHFFRRGGGGVYKGSRWWQTRRDPPWTFRPAYAAACMSNPLTQASIMWLPYMQNDRGTCSTLAVPWNHLHLGGLVNSHISYQSVIHKEIIQVTWRISAKSASWRFCHAKVGAYPRGAGWRLLHCYINITINYSLYHSIIIHSNLIRPEPDWCMHEHTSLNSQYFAGYNRTEHEWDILHVIHTSNVHSRNIHVL